MNGVEIQQKINNNLKIIFRFIIFYVFSYTRWVGYDTT